MNNHPILIVMLTYNDKTVNNAHEIFEQCKNSKAKYWGMKERDLPFEEMKKLYDYMKQCDKKTVLEVVAYTEDQCMKGANMAIELGCDILMGTIFFESINDLCKKYSIKYMPFVGNITGRPSILNGNIEEMIDEANEYIKKGAYGIDLLGYRYIGDTAALNKKFVENVNAPVCMAGSIDSFQRLDEVKRFSPRAFTVGSAFFENKFDGTFCEQINKVCDYIQNDLLITL